MHHEPGKRIETLPPHVDPALVRDFDVHHDARLSADIQRGYRELQEVSPDIFYSPMNGGHWVVTRYDLITKVMTDHAHFSNKELEIPKTSSPFVAVPINLDPPEHTPYRVMLTKYFSPKTIAELDPLLKKWADRLIDQVYPDGGCDFTEVLGAGFPVSVFMDMMGLPLERFEHFRKLVFDFFSDIPVEQHVAIQAEIVAQMQEAIQARRVERKDDLISKLIDETIRGRPIEEKELTSICLLLFLAGLDTVANVMTFTFRFLAEQPDMQDRLRDDPAQIPEFVDEALRRFAVVNGIRIVKAETDLGGVTFKEGDMVLAPLIMANLDDRKYDDPTDFRLDRGKRQHLTFSTGPHLCLGHWLARAELKMFVHEFLQRIPRFRVAEGFQPNFRKGMIFALLELPLEWDVARG